MEDKKTYSLSISKTNDDGTTSNVSLNTPYADEVMALLRLSGVAAPAATPGPIEVVADPHAMEPCDVDVVATEEYANEPNDTCYDTQAMSNFSLKRNMQKMNDVGNYRGDNKLGDVTESLESKYAAFKKKHLNEADGSLDNEFNEFDIFKVYIPANVYHGKWYGYGIYIYKITKNDRIATEQDAIDWVNSHKDEVLQRIGSERRNGRRVVMNPVEKNVFFKPTYKVAPSKIAARTDRYSVNESSDQTTDPKELAFMNKIIIKTLKTRFKGKAWFKGGSYSYLLDASKPNMMQASDGAPIRVKNFVNGLEDYCDAGVVADLFDAGLWLDPDTVAEYLRPYKAIRDQESHELANMRGD